MLELYVGEPRQITVHQRFVRPADDGQHAPAGVEGARVAQVPGHVKVPRFPLRGPHPVDTGRQFQTVVDADLDVYEGDTLAVIGESGSGKSTLVRLLLALDAPSSGTVTFDGRAVEPGPAAKLRWLRRETGIIFQDPYASLDPRMTVGDIVAVLDALQISEVDYYGDSYGTYVGQVFAARYPNRLRSIILDSAYPVRAAWPSCRAATAC